MIIQETLAFNNFVITNEDEALNTIYIYYFLFHDVLKKPSESNV